MRVSTRYFSMESSNWVQYGVRSEPYTILDFKVIKKTGAPPPEKCILTAIFLLPDYFIV